MNDSQKQNNQKYNDLLQQLNNEKLKTKNLEEEIQKLKNKLNELKNNNNILINENNNLKQRLENTNQFNQINQMNQFNQMNINEINNLRQIIIQKDKEINELKSKLPNNKVYMNDIMVINFLSTDQNIRCGIPCLADDTIAEVEEKLYQQFNEFRNTNNILLFGGNIILRFKKVRENNIHNGDTVLIQSQ
jgi:DNA repair exonuclease SbcCD ATPase subunit